MEYTGNYFNGSFGATNNALTASWKYRQKGTSSYTNGTTAISPTITNNSYKLSKKSLGTGFTYTKAYQIQIILTDKLTTQTTTIDVPQGIPVYDWGENFFNVNGDITKNDNANIYGETQLYNSDTGTAGNVTLSENCNSFKYIEIFYRLQSSNMSYYASCKVYNPNGKKATLVAIRPASNAIIIGSAIKTISETTISNDFNGTYTSFGTPAATNEIYIYRVVGYK